MGYRFQRTLGSTHHRNITSMSQLVVFAIAPSRLHADVAVSRLQHAANRADSIALMYSLAAAPNSAVCCYSETTHLTLAEGKPVAVSGFLSSVFNSARRDLFNPFDSGLLALGLSHEQRTILEDALYAKCAVVAVAVESLPEFLRACKLFQISGMERTFAANVENVTVTFGSEENSSQLAATAA